MEDGEHNPSLPLKLYAIQIEEFLSLDSSL